MALQHFAALGIFKYFLKYSFNNENTGVGVARELGFFKF